MLKSGEPALDFTLERARGGQFSLSETLAGGQGVLLIFLRHLG
jgi:peroxiredoxin